MEGTPITNTSYIPPLLTNSEFSVRLYVEEMLLYGGLSVCLCFMFCVFWKYKWEKLDVLAKKRV